MPSGRKISIGDQIIETLSEIAEMAPSPIASRIESLIDDYDRKTNYCARWARRQRYQNRSAP